MTIPMQLIPCGSYDIVLGNSLTSFIITDILRLLPSTTTFVILTDTNVYPLYAYPLYQQLRSVLIEYNIHHDTTKRVLIHAFPAGEASKCRQMKAQIEDQVFFQNRVHRDSCILAVGGGVVGDLSGYIAATYMRGIPFIQIPTSLLACVDSSIGGKTGIDVEQYGKNLLGAFHMPKRVYIDLDVLLTLPKREFINGMAEIIKAGAIQDSVLFELLENNTKELLSLSNMNLVQQMVAMAVQVKATIVTNDTKEQGIRAILNFGHSIGHGIEALLQPEWLHGECVAVGMMKEVELARALGYCNSATVGRLRRCLVAWGLPIRLPSSIQLNTGDILSKMEIDKKNAQGIKKLVLLTSIGTVLSTPAYVHGIPDEQIALVLEKYVQMVPTASDTVNESSLMVPGSKSISNRVLLMAALGQGTCRIHGLLHSDDTQVMMSALQSLGATFTWEQDGLVLVVTGTGGCFQPLALDHLFYLSNAGTAARFLTTTMTLLRSKQPVVITGDRRMKERPIAPLVDALRANGCTIEYMESMGCLPLRIIGEGLPGGCLPLAGKVSSQYVSSILLAAPYATSCVELKLQEEHPTSLPYIMMTIQLMKAFGIPVEMIQSNHYRIPCGIYQNPTTFTVEVDASSATYPLAFAAITGGCVTVEALGKTSVQGDAAFYSVLEKMGCKTQQTDTTTTVWGPPRGVALKAIEIDMETMTDAFMTAVAVAAVAQGTTKITGIANQRVKECNRIEVMCTELRKVGIKCGELEDGIWITGTGDRESYKSCGKAYISCHNDHRIAMSFAVLGSVIPDIVITDKDCTEKTYPEFWDHIQRFLHLRVEPVMTRELLKPLDASPAVFLVGMRGAGKTSLARAAATELGMAFLDTDEELVRKYLNGESIAAFVARHNGTWNAFREKQLELLMDLLNHPPSNTIIACGGGVVETPEIVQKLSEYKYVVHIHRTLEDILQTLSSVPANTPHRPSLGEDNTSVYTRRFPLYQQSSHYEFVINANDMNIERIAQDFGRFLQVVLPRPSISSKAAVALTNRRDSFFLSLTFPDLFPSVSLLPQVIQGVDAIELRVDLLADTSIGSVAAQVSFLRSTCPGIAIIYTVRSVSQGGAYPTDQIESMASLIQLGFRLGCEFVDIETSIPLSIRQQLIAQRGETLVIGSCHALSHRTTEQELHTMFQTCFHSGAVQVVKVVTRAYDVEDALLIRHIAQTYRDEWQQKMPIIALATSEYGKLTRVLNEVLTPVTHPLLPAAAAPGQLSVAEIMTVRKELGIVPVRTFALFGSPISKSPSPSMHNAAFQASTLPFTYTLTETTDVETVRLCMNQALSTGFGGGSITIPLKTDVYSIVDSLTPAARAIGAVNTLVRMDQITGNVLWQGDNTDWLGIYRPIAKRLSQINHTQATTGLTALIVGAGGTSMAAAYAMQQLGVDQLVVYNRTLANAEVVAARFNAKAVANLIPETLSRVDIVISTIPAVAGFTLPDYLLEKPGVIVLDAAYQPPITPCLAHASRHGAFCIQGYEMLYEQAYEQYQRWHRATLASTSQVDVDVLKQACLKHIAPEERLG